jgi:hemolysin III
MHPSESVRSADMIREWTLGEEVSHSITHGVMAALALLALPYAAVHAYLIGGVLQSATTSVFVISILLMFMASTLYHAMKPYTLHKDIFRILDHSFIYVAIAGSYTPLALCVIKGWEGIVIVVLQWLAVIAGILFKTLSSKALPKASVAVYLVMGWTALLVLPTLFRQGSLGLILLIFAGGLFYSAGVAFYASRFKFAHMIWHFFVALGAASHFIGIVYFIKP